MSVARQATAPMSADGPQAGVKPLLDLAAMDLSPRDRGRDAISKINPHRGDMALLDWIVWTSQDFKQGVALKHVRDTEFWVPGHFPDRPLFPGVLMVEAGAQLACFLYNSRVPDPKVVAFLRIEQCSFRSMVQPGDELYLLCSEVKFGRRRFVSNIQGIVGDRIAFDAQISGMSLEPEQAP
jgi:3-hydroxyacyl-[acyl-carrier-protein] dehydratase